MPTTAELALQKRYAELRAKKEKAAQAGPTHPATRAVKIVSKQATSAKTEDKNSAPQHQPTTKPRAPKVVLRSRNVSNNQTQSSRAAAALSSTPPTKPTPQAQALQSQQLDPQAAALEAAKRALAARQAVKEKQPAPEARVPKRPTFKRPSAKRPPTALPEPPPTQRARIAAPVSTHAVPPGNSGLGQSTSAAQPRTDSPAWSPTQDQPYSPGAQATAWSPTSAAPYSPTQQPSVPHVQQQGYMGTQPEHQIPAPHPHQANEAERTVYVGNVPDHISDAELAEYFCDVGEVLTVQIRGNDGGHYAFVEFALPEQVEQVLDLATQQPFMLEGVMLRVQPRHGKSGQQSAPSGQLGSEGYDHEAAELPSARAARIQAEVHAAAAAAVDELDPEILRNAAPAPPPDREIMVYDDI